jgi:hypothetical protein
VPQIFHQRTGCTYVAELLEKLKQIIFMKALAMSHISGSLQTKAIFRAGGVAQE